MTNASGARAAAPFARCAIAPSAASDGLGGQAYWHAVPPSINCLGRTAAAPQRGRPVRALGQRPARARPVAPLGCRGADHAARITLGRLLMGLAQARVRKLAFSNVFQRDVFQRESME